MPSNNLTSLYSFTPSTTVSTNNFTTLYNATPGNVTTANVPDRNFTTLYTHQTDVQPTYPYGNANVEAFLNVGYDAGGNIVQNINANGSIHANGNLTIVGTTSLGNVGNVHITGGNLNYILQTDGSGNLNWVTYPNVATEVTTFIHFDVFAYGNNQTFTNANLAVYANSNVMAVFKNGVNIEPSLYSISGNILTINILLNYGDTIDVLPGAVGSNLQPGGNLTEVQYNGGSGLLSGNSSFTFDQANSRLSVSNVTTTNANVTGITVSGITNLGNVGNVKITGGTNGYVLNTDGTGNLNWVAQGSIAIGGANTQVQYNNNSVLGGSANFVFNNTTNTLSVTNIIANGSQLSSLTAANIIGTVANANYATYAGDATTANSATTAGYAVSSDTANTSITVTANSQPNITSIGQLSSLASNGTVNFTNASNVSLGPVGNIHITGGTAGYYLSTDGVGNLNWQIPTATNANYANYAGNAFSVTGANVVGAVSLANTANIANYATVANSVAGANVSGQVGNALIAGTVYTNAQPNITSLGTIANLVASNFTSTGNVTIQRAFEVTTPNNTGSTGTIDYDVLTQSILYKTANASANCTLNIRGNSTITLNTILPVNETVTIVFLNTVGATAYVANSVQIDGVSVTPKYINGLAPTTAVALANSIQSYTYSIIKTAANTYSVLGSFVEFQ